MRNPINMLPLFRDERNYPQFLNKKARSTVVFLLVGALFLPSFALAIVMQEAQIRNHFVRQETLVAGLTCAALAQMVIALLIVFPLFSREKEKMIVDVDELMEVMHKEEGEVIDSRDRAVALVRHIKGLYEAEFRDLDKQARNWDDLVVKRVRWRDMSLGKKLVQVASVGFPLALAGWSVALMLGYMPKHPRNPALDATPNGRLMNEFFSGDHDFIIGLFIFAFCVIMAHMFYHMGRTDYRSKSDDALKKFMGEMGIK